PRSRHFHRRGNTRDTRADVHRDSGKILAEDFAFAGVQATAHLETKCAHSITDRAGTADRPRRPVERRQDAIPRGVDLASAILLQDVANFGEECREQFTPGIIAEYCGAFFRSPDLGKKNRDEHPFRLVDVARAGQKYLDLVEQRFAIPFDVTVVHTGKLDELGAWNALGHVARVGDVDHAFGGAVQNERWHADRRQ